MENGRNVLLPVGSSTKFHQTCQLENALMYSNVLEKSNFID